MSLWPAILLATLAGGIARAAPVLAAGFPVNDGGLFASIVDAILAGPRLLPASITYNELDAPLAYPPLAFLATAGLECILPIGTVEWLRWIPLVASIATIPALALLANELAPSRVHAAVATFAFALLPRSFEFLVMGGGLARAPGMFLAILAIYLCMRSLRRGDRSWVGAGVALGLAVATHPEGGLFAALSLSLVALAYARGRRAWSRMVAVAGIGVLVTLPWLVAVVAGHGIGPLESAGGTSLNLFQSLYYLVTANLTDEPLWALTGGLAVLGLIYSLAVRRFFVPLWVVAVVVANPRGAETYASVPIAILAAVGLLDVVVARVVPIGGDLASTPGWPASVLRTRAASAVLGGALVLAMLSAFLAPYLASPMASLDADARAAMTWVRDSLPAASRVVVVSGRPWYEDATAEWLPYLSGRVSVATVQGHEWLGSSSWQHQLDLAAALEARADDAVASLDEWAREYGVDYDYVYLPKGRLGGALSEGDCCSAMRVTIRQAPQYEIVYDGAGATIARRLD